MTWWCSATGLPWSWTWKFYPGVWLFVLALGVGYIILVRSVTARPPAKDRIAFCAGLAAIWAALDWPIGPLGAGYLASFHTVTYILLSLIAPPLLFLGLPREAVLNAARSRGWGAVLRALARPLPALATFNVLLIVTHLPDVVDGAMRSQLGAFAIDCGWFVGGLSLWWAVMAPTPEIGRMSRPLKMGYLFATTLLPTIPAAFLTFADYPLYAVYELAPRALSLSAHSDQQVAGLTMKVIGDLPLWFAFGVVFFRWARASEGSTPVHPSSIHPASL
jgi:putative membrane protein